MNLTFLVPETLLPQKIVKRGKVTKKLLFSNPNAKGVTEISILELSPNSEIALHTHPKDTEIYFLLNKALGTLCEIGDSHSLENETEDIMTVVSIKSSIPFDTSIFNLIF